MVNGGRCSDGVDDDDSGDNECDNSVFFGCVYQGSRLW